MWKRFCDIDHEITSSEYRKQTRWVYNLLAPFIGDILEEVKEHHERIMRAKAHDRFDGGQVLDAAQEAQARR